MAAPVIPAATIHVVRAIALAGLAGIAFAWVDRAEAADACDVMAAKLVADDGAVFERRTPSGVLHFKHPATLNFTIDCFYIPKIPPTLNITWDGAYPPAAFFAFVGRAGEVVVRTPARVIEATAKRCQRAALADEGGDAEAHAGSVDFGCSSFTQNGGGTHLAIRPEPKS